MSLPKLNNIIVVEDSAADRNMMIDFLSNYGASVQGFFTGDACIKEIVNQSIPTPDLILMDYFLDASFASKYDGLDTLAKVKEICPTTKIIMFTSVENARIIELAKEKGAVGYIVKGTEGFNTLDEMIRSNFLVN